MKIIITDRVESLSHRRGRVEWDHVLLNGLNRWRSKTLRVLRHETGSLRNETGRLWYKTSSVRKKTSRYRDLARNKMLLVEDRVLGLQSRDAVANICHKFHDLVLKHIGISDRENINGLDDRSK